MIHHISEPQKSFIVLNSNYSDQDTFEVDCRALTNGMCVGDVFEFHFEYNQSKETRVKCELTSIMMHGQSVRETTINQLFTCKFKVYDQESNQPFFHHSDVISSVKITGNKHFARNVIELESAHKYISKREIDRISKQSNEKLFIARTIGENIGSGQKFDIAWYPSKESKLLLVSSEIVSIYSRSYGKVDEIKSGIPTLVKLKCNNEALVNLNEHTILLGLLI